ncbi:MAG: DNA-processing protein DprA [Synergistaceae bacterium]|nr:DNA-processing protein DprA [Synergistaceae bacterium]
MAMKENNLAITRAALILNAIKAPYKAFINLCGKFNPEELFIGGENFYNELGLSSSVQSRLINILAKDNWVDKELEKIYAFDSRFINALDIDYPAKLRDLSKPPIGLYVKGSANISLPSVAIAGTRKCSEYGRNTAIKLAKALALSGIIIISGGARGIDAAAHRGCLSENGVTVAVFGTGLDKIYPTEHKDLFRQILETGGALISEYPMNSGGESWRFPERNRIIVALAGRVIIAESPEDGGAMITARYAQKLNRELWAVPGRINDETFRGSNSLLNEGTGAIISIEEFINKITANSQVNINFSQSESDSESKSGINDQNINLSSDEKIIYSLIHAKNNITSDELIISSKLNFTEIQSALVLLEAENLITSNAGRYSAVI